MRATAPTLRRRTFARAEATRAWVEATKRQALDTSDDDSLSDANSLNSLSDDNSLSEDNSLDSLSDSDAGRQQPPPRTTNPPQLTSAAKTYERLTAGSRGRVTRRSLEARQNLLDPNTSDDNSLSDGNSLSNSLDSLSADSSADEARPLPTSTTKRPNLSSKTRARLAAKHRRALDARQALDSDSADSVNDSVDSGAESSADEARPLKRPTRTQKTRARGAIGVRQAVDTSDDNSLDSGLSDNSLNSVDSLNSGLSDGNSSANEARPSPRPTLAPTNPPTLTQKFRNRLTAGQRASRRSLGLEARQNLLDPNTSDDNSIDSLSDDNSLSSLDSLDSNSIDSASDSDVARPQPTNPPNLTSKGPKRLGADAVSRPTRISARHNKVNKREILGKHSGLVASAEAAAEAEVPTIAPPDLVNAPAAGETTLPVPEEEEEGEEEDDADSVSSVSSDSGSEDEEEAEEEEEEEEKETGTGTAEPTATATDGAAATTVDGGSSATITSGPAATSDPTDSLAPVNSDDATALPNLTLAPGSEATASPSNVIGAIDGQPQADTQGQTQQTLVPVPKKMSGGATAGIVLGVLGFIALLAGFAFLFMRWRRRRQTSTYGTRLADEKGSPGQMPGGNVPPITFTHPSWPNNTSNPNAANANAASAARDPKTNSEIINNMMRAAYASNNGVPVNDMQAHHADHYIDEKAYAMLAGHPPTPLVAGTEKRGVSKWLADVMTPRPDAAARQSSVSQRWPYPVDPVEPMPMPMPTAQGGGPLPVGMPGYGPGNNGNVNGTTTKQKRLTPPRLPLKPVVPASLRPGAAAAATGPVGGTGLPPGSGANNARMTVATQTTNTTSSSARWG